MPNISQSQDRKVRIYCKLSIAEVKKILHYAHENPKKSHSEIAKIFSHKFGKKISRIIVAINWSRQKIISKRVSHLFLPHYKNGYYYEVPIKDLDAEERADLNLSQMCDSNNAACESPTSPQTSNESTITK